MNGINPIWLTVLTFLVVSLDHVFSPALIPWVQGWSGFLAFLGGALATALSTIQSAAPGLFIKRPETARAAAIALLVVGGMLVCPAMANAQGVRRVAPAAPPAAGTAGPKILTAVRRQGL
jgi:hypothetical protein